MARKAEVDLDAALAALARDLRATEPRPGPGLTAGVLADAALTTFAAEARTSSPRPGPALVARVLADAAAVAAAVERPAPRTRGGAAVRRGGLGEWLFGWAGGAVAAMVLALAAGVGLGLEADALPLLDPVERDLLAVAEVEPTFLLVEGP